MSIDEMKNYLDLKTEDIEDKTVLEIGCGAGPYLDVSARIYNAKHIIGIDLSRAVDAAYENVGNLDNVTIIQADLFNLPFKKDFFDYVSADEDCILEHAPLKTLAKDKEFIAYKHDGFWQCMDTKRDLDRLQVLYSKEAPWLS